MNVFTIKDLENLSGIKAHTIRIWEQRYSFLNPRRTGTNIRNYSNTELQTILNIALLNKYGFKISHINKMTPQEMNDQILALAPVQAQQERVVNQLIHFMADIQMEEFELVLNGYIKSRGIEKAIMQIIFPFLERIGILWVTNHIIPAQEHLVSNIIRRKLMMGIETLTVNLATGKTALLFLPEGEHHELGLLFVQYLLKRQGIRVLYVGANIPLKDLAYIVNIKEPELLYTHLTSVARNFNFEKFLESASRLASGRPVIVSGILTQAYKKKVPADVCLKKSLAEVMEYIGSL